MSVIAIDFGTSNTVVCRWDPVTGDPVTCDLGAICRQFPEGEGTVAVTPSLVVVQSPISIVIGDPVRTQRLGIMSPNRYFQGFKRDLIALYAPPARRLDDQTFAAPQIAQLFLTHIVQQVKALGIPCEQVIFTVPVGASESYSAWIQQLALDLALPGIQIIDEATAAALSYALQQPGSLVLVLDFGGGTLDLSLVRLLPVSPQTLPRVEVIAKADAYLGGIDIDVWIVEAHLERWGRSRAEISDLAWHWLLELAEKLKIGLTHAEVMGDSWFDDETFTAYEVSLSQAELQELLERHGFLDQVRQVIDEVILTANGQGIQRGQIDQVILVGGTSQLQAVQSLVMSSFGAHKVNRERPFTAVAAGALAVSTQVKIQESLRHGYALRLWDPYQQSYFYVPLFEPGIPYPCEQESPLILQVAQEGQREIRLDVGRVTHTSQAEVTYDDQGRMSSRQVIRANDFRPLAGVGDPPCLVRLDPVGKPGIDRLRVNFAVDQRRALRATLTDLLSGEILVTKGLVGYLT